MEDLMKPLGLTVNGLARELKLPVTRISEIVNGRRGLNADTALRLSRYFGSTPEFWMRLQADYDLKIAAADKRVMARFANCSGEDAGKALGLNWPSRFSRTIHRPFGPFLRSVDQVFRQIPGPHCV